MKRYKELFAAGMTQWGLFLSMGTINLLVPRLLGANQYGLSSFVIAAPFFFQGIFEAIHYAVSVKWAGKTDENHIIKITAIFSFIWLLIGCVITSLLIYFNPIVRQNDHPGIIVGLANLLLILLFGATWLTGRGFAGFAYRVIATSTIVFSLTLVMILLFFKVHSVKGYLLTHCLAQLFVIVYLYVNLQYQNEYSLLKSTGIELNILPVTEISVSAISRFSIIALNTVTIIIAGYYLSQKSVAELKLSISMISAGMLIIPISPVMIQQEAEGLHSQSSGPRAKRIIKLLFGSIGLSLILVAGIMSIGRPMLLWLLSGRGFSGLNIPIIMSLPFFSLFPMVNAVNIGIKKYHSLYIAIIVMMISLGIGVHALGVGWGFFIATGFYSIPLLISTLVCLRARIAIST